MLTPTVTETAVTKEGCKRTDNPMTVENRHQEEVSLFTPTVPADDGCIDTCRDEFGFLNHA